MDTLGYQIDRLFAYLSTDEAGGEGVIAVSTPTGAMPLVGADADRMMSYQPFAREAAQRTGRPVRLVRFDRRTVLEEIQP